MCVCVCVCVCVQLLLGHGLDVPTSVKQNTSAISFVFDGKVHVTMSHVCCIDHANTTHAIFLSRTPQGYAFEYSVLFYGYYDSGQNEPYSPPPSNPHPFISLHYKLPLAYLLVIVSLFLCSAALLLLRLANKIA